MTVLIHQNDVIQLHGFQAFLSPKKSPQFSTEIYAPDNYTNQLKENSSNFSLHDARNFPLTLCLCLSAVQTNGDFVCEN